MFLRKLAVILCALIVVVGCEKGNDTAACTFDDTVATNDFEASIKTTDKYDQFSTSFVQGDEINITLSIKNISSETKTLYFSNSKQYDFVIKNCDGVEVWRWSANLGFLPVVTSYDLAPGEVKTFTEKWSQAIADDGTLIPVGNYTLEADDIGIALKPSLALNII